MYRQDILYVNGPRWQFPTPRLKSWLTVLAFSAMADKAEKITPRDSSSGDLDGNTVNGENGTRGLSTATTARKGSMTAAEVARRNANAKLANPLAGYSHAELKQMGREYVAKHYIGDEEDIRAFELGACLAQDPGKFDTIEGMTEEELSVLRKEVTSRWSQPRLMYLVIVLCSTCAAVQGMGKCTSSPASLITGATTSIVSAMPWRLVVVNVISPLTAWNISMILFNPLGMSLSVHDVFSTRNLGV